MDWAGMREWVRDTYREAASRPLEHCPNDGTRLIRVRGRLWCPFDGWTDQHS